MAADTRSTNGTNFCRALRTPTTPKHGKEVSSTFSQDKTSYDGTKQVADGTEATMTRTADGKCTGGVTAPDGRHGVLPDEFFTHPALTTVKVALYDTVTAMMFQNTCVAAISGSAGVAGGAASGTLFAAGATAMLNPELA